MRKYNPPITEFAVAFCKIWTFRLGLKGGGALVRMLKRLLPDNQRFYLDYPGFGRCNISFLDFNWLRQVCCGLNEERALIEQIKSLSAHYPVIWDVGANSGYLAVELALQLSPDRLILFEPNPEHHETLSSLADMKQGIQVCMTGLSDRSGTAVLHIPGEADSGSTCASLHKDIVSTNSQLFNVNVTLEPGDALIAAGVVPVPNLIIIDVEGHEESVIAGLAETIKSEQPIIILEHIFLSDEIMKNLIPPGYVAHTICDKSSHLVAGVNKSLGHNLLLLPTTNNIQP